VCAPDSLPRLRRLPVPQTAPRPALRVIGEPVPGAVPPTQGTLALALPLPSGEDEKDRDSFTARRPTSAAELPDPRRWAAAFVVAALETTMGRRPLSQLVRWSSDDVRLSLARRAALVSAAPGRSAGAGQVRVRSLRAYPPADGVVEVSAVLHVGSQVRAVALRLEGLDGRWRVTALELG
jgi:hypothetical protein